MGQQVTAEIFEMYKMQGQLLPKLQVKLHLINVDYFPTNETPLKQLCKKGYKLVVINGTSHYPMLESPERLTEAIDGTVNEILQSTMADAN
jgi:pimeloyl-ACP methyl ester carboxylesterase